ncbi:LPS export ABC transporter permease LptG [bacterium]|nr:LPS export ABC transporter permease LptG [bacterium]
MRLRVLDRYIGAQFARMFALCLSGFVVIYIVVDFIERSSQIFKSDPPLTAVALYFLYKMPLILFQIVPVACLLGALLSLIGLARGSEITAIKAGGVPILRACAPILALSALISGGAFLINEYVVPRANETREYIYKVQIKKQVWRVKYRKQNVYYKSGETIYSFGLFVPEQGKISDVRLYRFDENFHLAERAIAETARYAGDHWELVSGVAWRFAEGRIASSTPFETLAIDLDETPEEMKIYQKDPETMSYRELAALVGELEEKGYDTTSYRVDMQGKLAFPLVPVIMAMLSVPFAVRIGRSGGIALGVGIAVVIGVVYWIVLGLGLALGKSGALPPVAAAWGSHVIFGLGGLVGLVKVRQ